MAPVPKNAAGKEKLFIFDTTLRDGEQTPGVTLMVSEKIEIARQLSRLGVDICEAGFPAASVGDFESVQRVAREVGPLTEGRASGEPMTIVGLARSVPADIQRAYDAVKDAPKHRIHVFLATSDIHLEYKLRISREECVKRAVAAVTFAKSLCADIEFSPEDASRSDWEFLVTVLSAVVKAGATTLNIPDTVGYNTPEAFGELMAYLVKHVEGADQVVFSTHCHNDLGLATANTLAGVRGGARQVEVTINGIGERAGNTALEEVVMAIHTHAKSFPVYTDIDTRQIVPASQLVTKRTGCVIQVNKAIVGGNAFAHESGIHQDGMLKNRETYEIISPELIGLTQSNGLVLGKHSGRNAFRSHLEALLRDSPNHDLFVREPKLVDTLFVRFKEMADAKKSGVTDSDLYALLDEVLHLQSSGFESFRLEHCQVVSGSHTLATATIALWDRRGLTDADADGDAAAAAEANEDTSPLTTTTSRSAEDPRRGKRLQDAAVADGPVAAIFSAINRLVGIHDDRVLTRYEVQAVTEGSDALGRVVVRIAPSERAVASGDAAPAISERDMYQGAGTHEDILQASARAYLNAINKMLDAEAAKRRYGEAQQQERRVNV